MLAPSMPEGRWLDVEGIRTRYYEAGSGDPIVFVYGGNFGTSDSASSAYTWSLNWRALAGTHRVVIPDKLAQGYTGNPKTDADYTMQAVVQHLAAFLRALKLPPVHIVGHSRGGYASVRLALEHHDLVRSVTVVNSGTLSPGVGTNEVILSRPPHPKFTAECVRWVYQSYSFNPDVVTDEWVNAVLEVLALPKYRESVRKIEDEKLGLRLFLPELARDKRETLQWLAEGRLQRPVQVIWGYDDRTTTIDRGIEVFRLVAKHERRAQLHVINQAGHFPFREHPERFNALLARFVATC
jgi:2-hydroxy-6-oxonona-2,4-dienedioate hydrolase